MLPVFVKLNVYSNGFQYASDLSGAYTISAEYLELIMALLLNLQRDGMTIQAERLNFHRYISHFRSVHRGSAFAKMRTTSVRKLLPEYVYPLNGILLLFACIHCTCAENVLVDHGVSCVQFIHLMESPVVY